MIRRVVVLIIVLLGVPFSSIGYTAETILIQGKVTGRFPICQYSKPGIFPLPPKPGQESQGFVFLPAQLVNGTEGVYASWYTESGLVAGVWPLSAVTVTNATPENFTVNFTFDTAGPYKPVYGPFGVVSSFSGSCRRVAKGAVSVYSSDIVSGRVTSELFFAIAPGVVIDQINTVSGKRTLTSGIVNALINDQTMDVVGVVESWSGQATILVKAIQ
jgi:hypothetical protein